jgi:hypothetical protein
MMIINNWLRPKQNLILDSLVSSSPQLDMIPWAASLILNRRHHYLHYKQFNPSLPITIYTLKYLAEIFLWKEEIVIMRAINLFFWHFLYLSIQMLIYFIAVQLDM